MMVVVLLLAALVIATPGTALAAGNNALQFNGSSQHVTFGVAPQLGASTFTLETWFKRTGAGVGTSTGEIFAIPLVTKGRSEKDGSTKDMNYFLGIDASSGKLAADFEEGAAAANPGLGHPIIGNTVISMDIWHHAAATYDGQTWRLYLDGNADGSLTLPSPTPPRSDSIQHAALATAMNSSGSASGHFAGVLDEARIWNVARTQSQIQATKNQEVTSSAGLIGRWGMNEGSGSSVADSSGSGVTGTAVGGPSWVGGFSSPPPGGAPNAPTLVTPTNGATNVGTAQTFTVSVSDPNGDATTVRFYGRQYRSGIFQQFASNANVPSGTNTSATWPGRSAGQRFEWYATVSDASATTTGSTWTFTSTAGSDPVLVGAGDIAECGGPLPNAIATGQILAGVTGGVFNLGDNAYPNGTASEFNNCYDPAWGAEKSRTRAVAGNHEWNNGNLSGYFGYFGSNSQGPGGTSYYSYNVGSYWHVVVLDSECQNGKVPGGCASNSPQVSWLRADLAANSSRHVIAMWHRPYRSSSSYNSSLVRPFWDELYAAGAEMVLDGHAHFYERLKPLTPAGAVDTTNGMRTFTVGTGGDSQGSIGTVLSTSEARGTSYGVLKLTLHPSSYDWEFMPVAGATYSDSGSSPTHGAPPGGGPPVATPQSVSTPKETAATVTLAGTDPDNDPLTYAIGSLPSHGQLYNGPTASGSPLGAGAAVTDAQHRVTYLPASGYTGSDQFTFTVNDGTSTSAPATVSITVSSPGGAGPITFRAGSTGANNIGNSVTIPVPSGTQPGDVMVAVVDVKATPAVGTPAGWTLVSDNTSGSSMRQLVFWRVATGSEPAGYTWTYNQNRAASGAILAYSGVSAVDPIQTFSAGTGTTTSITAPSVNTIANGSMIVGGFGINDDSTIEPPAGMIERGEIVSATRLRTEVSDYVQGTAGATGAKTATAAIAAANIGQLIALRPGAPPGNRLPTFDQDLPNRTDPENATISLSAHATDPENDPLTYAATGLPPGLSINTSTGLITGTISAGASAGSPYPTSITVSDNGGTTVGATDTFTWNVAPPPGGGGAITFRGAEMGANNIGKTVTIPVPASTQAGDVMVAVVDVKRTPPVTEPSGWTLVSDTANGSNFHQLVYWRVATGSEPASYTWSYTENRAASGAILTYAGVETVLSTPVEAFSAGTGSTTSITAPSVTSAYDGAMIVGAFGIDADSAIDPPPVMVERGEIVSATRLRTEVADYVLTSAGATGPRTATAAVSAPNIGQMIVLRPDPPSSGSPPNQPPTFDQNLPNRTDPEGAVIDLPSKATDPNGDPLTYAATGLPTGLSINTSTGRITGTISAGASAGSPYPTIITVSEDGGATVADTDTFTWNVTAPPPPGGGAISYRGSSFGANDLSTSLVLPVPAAVQAGDVMVAIVTVGTTPNVTPPAGWNVIREETNGSRLTQGAYWRVATGSEPSTYTWDLSRSRAASGGIVAYSGVNASNPVDVSGARSANASDIVAPSVVSGFSGSRLIGAFGIKEGVTLTVPAGMVERGQATSTTRVATLVADLGLGSPGATGDKTSVSPTSDYNLGMSIVLRAA